MPQYTHPPTVVHSRNTPPEGTKNPAQLAHERNPWCREAHHGVFFARILCACIACGCQRYVFRATITTTTTTTTTTTISTNNNTNNNKIAFTLRLSSRILVK